MSVVVSFFVGVVVGAVGCYKIVEEIKGKGVKKKNERRKEKSDESYY